MSTLKPKHVRVNADGSIEPRGRPSADVAIKLARKRYEGQRVAVIRGADWVAQYFDCVLETRTGRPLIPVEHVSAVAQRLAEDHKVTISRAAPCPRLTDDGRPDAPD
ncbi:hypothetical protein [Natrinema sp. 1APR25-10V2]|uniref:hypothetical protein n=1 Tax=Natrinema sp. 1APR25-10V2 TaxID=2951081 RepID=UPI002876BF51|nr:hypothetical protein [Natrinema sp. 1APR25-10V2]MDS0474367.1 hypothetical protein [Natrinema sp. 1APR25-10V2]